MHVQRRVRADRRRQRPARRDAHAALGALLRRIAKAGVADVERVLGHRRNSRKHRNSGDSRKCRHDRKSRHSATVGRRAPPGGATVPQTATANAPPPPPFDPHHADHRERRDARAARRPRDRVPPPTPSLPFKSYMASPPRGRVEGTPTHPSRRCAARCHHLDPLSRARTVPRRTAERARSSPDCPRSRRARSSCTPYPRSPRKRRTPG